MKLYRSIGDEEFFSLLHGDSIEGRYCNFKKNENVLDKEDIGSVVCFFVDKIRWKDAKHTFFLEVEIPDEELIFGTGIYYAAKSLGKTKTWTGRNGHCKYEFKEAYAKKYNVSNIKAIYFGNRFANWFREETLFPWINKNNITILEQI